MHVPKGTVIWINLLLLCLAWAPPRRALAGAEARPERAALVNGVLITRDDFLGELKRTERLAQRGKLSSGAVGAAAKKQALENLIVRELLFQEGTRRGVRVSAAEVAEQLVRLKKELPGENLLETALDRMGLAADDLETQLAKGMLIQKFIDAEFAGQAAVTDSDLAFYYQDHPDQFTEPLRIRLSHILVRIDPSWNDARKGEGRARIEAIRRRVLAGEDFARLARKDSDCFSAKNGGDLGYFLPGQLSRGMEDEARNLKPGGVSGVVEDRYGLHLLKLTELRPASRLPLESVKGKLRQELVRERELQALAPLLKRLRARAKVEILLNEDEP